MEGGNLNEPTTSAQILFTRERFEREVVLGDRPPYYLDTERHEKETKRRWKIFELPYNAGYCTVYWKDDQWSFSYRT